MTQTEKIGFGKNMLELVEKESAVLERAGYNPGEIHAILTEKYEKASEANARQEEMKRASKQQTEETVALTDDLYRTASGYLDAAIAAAGKGSEAAKNFQRLRSRVRAPGEGEAPEDEGSVQGGTP
ncbi:MAG: hypothetical protein HY557_03700 [Euryarchaeota archaeon]|nr:hypothetical protein [Euryarchaeota archaeon]